MQIFLTSPSFSTLLFSWRQWKTRREKRDGCKNETGKKLLGVPRGKAVKRNIYLYIFVDPDGPVEQKMMF